MIRILFILLIPTFLLSKDLNLDKKFFKADSCFRNDNKNEFKQLELELSKSNLSIDRKFYLKSLLVEIENDENHIGKAFGILKYIHNGLYEDSLKFKDWNFAKCNYFISLGNVFFSLRNFSNAISAYNKIFKYSKNESQTKANAMNIILSYYFQNDFVTPTKYFKYINDSINLNYLNLVKSSRLNDTLNFYKYYNSKYLDSSKLNYINTVKIRFESNPKETYLKLYISETDESQKTTILYEAYESNNIDSSLMKLFLLNVIKNEKLVRYEYANFIDEFLENNQLAQNLNSENQFKTKYIKILTYSIVFVIVALFLVIIALFYYNKGLNEQKLLNNELNLNKKELQTLIKTKNEILTILSHDIKTPLVGMNMLLETLTIQNTKKVIDFNSFISIWEFFKQTLDSTLNMTNNILAYSKAIDDDDHKTFESVSINKIIENVHNINIANIDSKNIQINYNLIDLNISTNKIYFEAIYRNILSNAIKYTSQDGTIQVVLNENQLSITNYNCFMSKEDIDSILDDKFEKVVSTKGSKGEVGSGYGLKIVNSIVKQLNMKLDISSNDEETRFTINLKEK